MRGKNILLLPLILALGLTMLGPVNAPVTSTKISVEPSVVTGIPGDSVLVSINVKDVTDLYAFGFTLQIAPYAKILALVNVMDGGFLMDPDGNPCFLTYSKDPFHGTIQVGATLLGEVSGVSGSGTIAMIEFSIIEAGESPLDLKDTLLLDTQLNAMPHNTFNGFFRGPTAILVEKNLPGISVKLGETINFLSKAKNLGNVPLYVRTRWVMTGEDGRVLTYYSGQRTFPLTPKPDALLYVDGYQQTWNQWTTVGSSPWLDTPGDGNYIESTTNALMEGKFTFQDLTLGPMDIVKSVSLEFYTFGPYDESNDFDVVAREPIGEAAPSLWLGSAYSSGTPGWTGLRWVDTQDISTIFSALKTEAGINGFKIRYIQFYTGDGLPRPPAGIDAVRMRIQFAGGLVTVNECDGYKVIQPNDIVWLCPYVWETSEGTINKWFTTVTIEYKYYSPTPGNPTWWIEDKEKEETLTWWCKP